MLQRNQNKINTNSLTLLMILITDHEAAAYLHYTSISSAKWTRVSLQDSLKIKRMESTRKKSNCLTAFLVTRKQLFFSLSVRSKSNADTKLQIITMFCQALLCLLYKIYCIKSTNVYTSYTGTTFPYWGI